MVKSLLQNDDERSVEHASVARHLPDFYRYG
jgi:hypothetical protein